MADKQKLTGMIEAARNNLSVILGSAFVGVLLAGAVGGWLYYAEYKAHKATTADLTKKIELAQRKFTEEKALGTNLDNQRRLAQAELDKVAKERESLGAELGKLRGKTKLEEAELKDLADKFARLQTAQEEVAKKYGDAATRVAAQEKDIQRLTTENRGLQADVRNLKQGLGICITHNKALSGINDELVAAYQNKGVGTALLQKEPLTQVKRVEMEKLVQEYRDKIDQHKIQTQ
jgi:chromosome segregation ATPase